MDDHIDSISHGMGVLSEHFVNLGSDHNDNTNNIVPVVIAWSKSMSDTIYKRNIQSYQRKGA